jgi:hypothetical protein
LTEDDTGRTDTIFEEIPDERRDWRNEVANLRKRVGDFNINNYVTKVLTEQEQKDYARLKQIVPADTQVYMQ